MSARSIEMLVSPPLLSWARASVGLDVSSAARKVHVASRKIESWESGATKPTLTQAEKLASVYRRPLATFYLPRPPIEPSLPTDFRVLAEHQGQPLSYETRLAIRRAWRLQSTAEELLVALNRETKVTLPKLRLSSGPDDEAARVRQALGIGVEDQYSWHDPYEALRRWRAGIERSGVLVFQLPTPLKDTRGFSLPSRRAPAIVVSSKDHPRARQFSLFHELAHLLTDTSALCDMEITWGGHDREHQAVEKFCNQFAGAVLVPQDALLAQELVKPIRRPKPWSDEALSELSDRFKVSREVILRRLLDLKLATRDLYLRKREDWMELARRQPKKKSKGGQSPAKRCVYEQGVPYVALVLESLGGDKITYAQATDYLGVRAKHLAKIAEVMVDTKG